MESEPEPPAKMPGQPIANGVSEHNSPPAELAPAPSKDEPQEPKPAVKEKKPFSWLDPHPIFVIILVGPEERPYGIQKDFLCDRSEYFQKMFDEKPENESVEHIVKLPEASPEVFGLAQNYMYTEKVIMEPKTIPSYENLVGLWRLGHKLGIAGLCDQCLVAMTECRRLTKRIPATPLLIQVWKDTPEGSTIRRLLLSWAAEYMRSSDARAEFAKSLPQEVLSELVVTMSAFDSPPIVQATAAAPSDGTTAGTKKNVHYLEEGDDEETMNNTKRNRLLSGVMGGLDTVGRPGPRPSLPKPQKRRSSGAYIDPRSFTTSQKLSFCADLLARMLSGPGFWTRLVGPFREPVDPDQDGVPDYFNKVKRPMDLNTIKDKMDGNQYKDDEEFAADVRQIFENCFLYWKKGDAMWNAGEKLQKTFEDKYAGMNKWISKMDGDEGE